MKMVGIILGMSLLLGVTAGAVTQKDAVNPNRFTQHVSVDGKEVSYRVVGGEIFIALKDLRQVMNLGVELKDSGKSVVIKSQPCVPSQALAATQQSASKQIDPAAARQAVEAVEALVSAVHAGVSYDEYSRRKADTKIAVDKFSNEYGGSDPIAQGLNAAMRCFDLASTTWNYFLNVLGSKHMGASSQSDPANALIKALPELEAKVTGTGDMRELALEDVLAAIWSRAADQVKAVRASLPADGSATKPAPR